MIEDRFLKAALSAADQAGLVLLKHWGKLRDVKKKTFSWDLVTEADKESEAVILKELLSQFPNHQFLAEESGLRSINHSDYLWVIDPLDGTTNYTHQYPMVSITIALLYHNEPIIGVTYNPIFKELFQVVKGHGTFLNGEKIEVSKTRELASSLLATGFAYDRNVNPENNYAEFCRLTNLSQGVRRLGSAALDLAYVAAGRLDGYWERGLKPWDIAAGALMVKEAGGKVTDYNFESVDLFSGKILATNGIIHQELSDNLTHIEP